MSVDVKKRKSQKQCSHSDRDDLPLVDPYVTVWVLHCALTLMKPYQHTLLSTVHPQHLIFCTLMHIPPVRPCRAQTHYKTQAAGYERQWNQTRRLETPSWHRCASTKLRIEFLYCSYFVIVFFCLTSRCFLKPSLSTHQELIRLNVSEAYRENYFRFI